MTTQSVEASIIISARETASQAFALVAQGMRSILTEAQALKSEVTANSAALTGLTVATDSASQSHASLFPALDGAIEKFKQISEPVGAFNEAAVKVNGTITDVKDALTNTNTIIDVSKAAYDEAKMVIANFKNGLNALKPVLTGVSISMRSVLIASGIGLVIAAVTLLFEAWTNNWGGIQEKAQAVIDFVSELIGTFVEFFKDHWKEIATVLAGFIAGPLGLFALGWSTNAFGIRDKLTEIWNGIKNFLSDTWDAIVEAVKKPFDIISNTIGDVWERVKHVTSSVWDSTVGVLKGAINKIIGFINVLIRAWNKIKFEIPKKEFGIFGQTITIGGLTFGVPEIPEIPELAKGGVVNRPTLALLGEGGPEAVVPLRRRGLGASAMQPITVNVIVDGRIVKSMAVEGVREAFVRAGLGPGAFAPGV